MSDNFVSTNDVAKRVTKVLDSFQRDLDILSLCLDAAISDADERMSNALSGQLHRLIESSNAIQKELINYRDTLLGDQPIVMTESELRSMINGSIEA